MPRDTGALLIADIGTLFTHVFLVDQVAGEYRLIAHADVPTTIEPPQANAMYGIVAAARRIEQVVGRPLVRDDTLITPQTPDGNGIDALVCVSSAAGMVPIVVAAIDSQRSGASLLRVARSTYTTVLGMLTLDEPVDAPLDADQNWMDHQLENLVHVPGATVLLAGGVEGGTIVPLERLARALALTVLRRDQRTGRDDAHVVYAGNSAARATVETALETVAPVTVTANVRPQLDVENLAPARTELRRLYTDRVLGNLPGAATVRSHSAAPLRATADGFDLLARFISQFHGRPTLLIDIGAMTTIGCLAMGDQAHLAMETNLGTAYGAGGVLTAVGTAAIARWLPFEMDESTLREAILNRLLRPQIVPSTPQELLLEQAIAREALAQVLQHLHAECPDLYPDLVIAGGGVLAHTRHPAEALLVVLDALQRDQQRSCAITDIYLDQDGLLSACGALAWYNADAAWCVQEYDLLRNGLLASCVVALGGDSPGDHAVEAELTPIGGQPISVRVAWGEISRLPLAPGRRATLRLRPARGVWIGANEPGAEVLSDIAAVHGSVLGVVIDARGRPLPFDDAEQRRAAAWNWLAQLGAVPMANPYAAAEPASFRVPDVSAAMVDEHTAEPVPAPAWLDQQDEPAPPPAWLDQPDDPVAVNMPADDQFDFAALPDWLDADSVPEAPDAVLDLEERTPPAAAHDFSELRAELEQQPKKRGFFGRRQ